MKRRNRKNVRSKKITVSIDGTELKGFSIPEEKLGDFYEKLGIVITDKVLEKTLVFMKTDDLTFREALIKATYKVVYMYADESEV